VAGLVRERGFCVSRQTNKLLFACHRSCSVLARSTRVFQHFQLLGCRGPPQAPSTVWSTLQTLHEEVLWEETKTFGEGKRSLKMGKWDAMY
jgi:hypothetical protein